MDKRAVLAWLDEHETEFKDMAQKIWEKPETAFKEYFASTLQAEALRNAGFNVKQGLPGMPTAVVAEYGGGRPVIGILGEYDALPKLSQKVGTRREPVIKDGPGHGCGHNLLGTAGVAAAIAVKNAIEAGELKGTVRYYGCPAEETLAGKVFMARLGVFNDLDASLSWHPASMNTVWGCSFLAMNSVMFRFSGVSAHAAAAPQLGRSALDGVELMNVGANYLREHVDEKARIHYAITDGGGAPNLVPAEASVWYYVRAPKRAQVEEIYARLKKIAQGAAMMTETSVEEEILAACYDVLPNQALGELLFENMQLVGGPKFSKEDRELAQELSCTLTQEQKEKVMKTYFAPPEVLSMVLHEGVVKNRDKGEVMAGSTDVGDVSYIVPFAQFTAATWPVGTAAHSWQATAASGSGIGFCAMHFAAKVLAATVYDLLADDGTVLQKAKAEFQESTGGKPYVSPLPPDVKPPA
ncbi:MAG: M20 family metallopeptidase [Bacillota bacterium]